MKFPKRKYHKKKLIADPNMEDSNITTPKIVFSTKIILLTDEPDTENATHNTSRIIFTSPQIRTPESMLQVSENIYDVPKTIASPLLGLSRPLKSTKIRPYPRKISYEYTNSKKMKGAEDRRYKSLGPSKIQENVESPNQVQQSLKDEFAEYLNKKKKKSYMTLSNKVPTTGTAQSVNRSEVLQELTEKNISGNSSAMLELLGSEDILEPTKTVSDIRFEASSENNIPEKHITTISCTHKLPQIVPDRPTYTHRRVRKFSFVVKSPEKVENITCIALPASISCTHKLPQIVSDRPTYTHREVGKFSSVVKSPEKAENITSITLPASISYTHKLPQIVTDRPTYTHRGVRKFSSVVKSPEKAENITSINLPALQYQDMMDSSDEEQKLLQYKFNVPSNKEEKNSCMTVISKASSIDTIQSAAVSETSVDQTTLNNSGNISTMPEFIELENLLRASETIFGSSDKTASENTVSMEPTANILYSTGRHRLPQIVPDRPTYVRRGKAEQIASIALLSLQSQGRMEFSDEVQQLQNISCTTLSNNTRDSIISINRSESLANQTANNSSGNISARSEFLKLENGLKVNENVSDIQFAASTENTISKRHTATISSPSSTHKLPQIVPDRPTYKHREVHKVAARAKSQQIAGSIVVPPSHSRGTRVYENITRIFKGEMNSCEETEVLLDRQTQDRLENVVKPLRTNYPIISPTFPKLASLNMLELAKFVTSMPSVGFSRNNVYKSHGATVSSSRGTCKLPKIAPRPSTSTLLGGRTVVFQGTTRPTSSITTANNSHNIDVLLTQSENTCGVSTERAAGSTTGMISTTAQELAQDKLLQVSDNSSKNSLQGVRRSRKQVKHRRTEEVARNVLSTLKSQGTNVYQDAVEESASNLVYVTSMDRGTAVQFGNLDEQTTEDISATISASAKIPAQRRISYGSRNITGNLFDDPEQTTAEGIIPTSSFCSNLLEPDEICRSVYVHQGVRMSLFQPQLQEKPKHTTDISLRPSQSHESEISVENQIVNSVDMEEETSNEIIPTNTFLREQKVQNISEIILPQTSEPAAILSYSSLARKPTKTGRGMDKHNPCRKRQKEAKEQCQESEIIVENQIVNSVDMEEELSKKMIPMNTFLNEQEAQNISEIILPRTTAPAGTLSYSFIAQKPTKTVRGTDKHNPYRKHQKQPKEQCQETEISVGDKIVNSVDMEEAISKKMIPMNTFLNEPEVQNISEIILPRTTAPAGTLSYSIIAQKPTKTVRGPDKHNPYRKHQKQPKEQCQETEISVGDQIANYVDMEEDISNMMIPMNTFLKEQKSQDISGIVLPQTTAPEATLSYSFLSRKSTKTGQGTDKDSPYRKRQKKEKEQCQDKQEPFKKERATTVKTTSAKYGIDDLLSENRTICLDENISTTPFATSSKNIAPGGLSHSSCTHELTETGQRTKISRQFQKGPNLSKDQYQDNSESHREGVSSIITTRRLIPSSNTPLHMKKNEALNAQPQHRKSGIIYRTSTVPYSGNTREVCCGTPIIPRTKPSSLSSKQNDDPWYLRHTNKRERPRNVTGGTRNIPGRPREVTTRNSISRSKVQDTRAFQSTTETTTRRLPRKILPRPGPPVTPAQNFSASILETSSTSSQNGHGGSQIIIPDFSVSLPSFSPLRDNRIPSRNCPLCDSVLPLYYLDTDQSPHLLNLPKPRPSVKDGPRTLPE